MVKQKLIDGIKLYFKQKCAVVGLSGGVDSSTVAFLAVAALGKDKVIGISMPEEGLSSKETKDYAKLVADKLGIKFYSVPINSFISNYKALPWKEGETAKMNTKARVRATILYHFANTHDALVIGTGNKTEMVLGYFTKYGDGAVDIEPIGELWKWQVFELAKQLGVPEEIIKRTPTAELYHGHTDEDEIGAKYVIIDKILMLLEQGKSKNEMITLGFDRSVIEKLMARINDNKHKTSLPPTINIT